jgi:hypothetical protein
MPTSSIECSPRQVLPFAMARRCKQRRSSRDRPVVPFHGLVCKLVVTRLIMRTGRTPAVLYGNIADKRQRMRSNRHLDTSKAAAKSV